MILLTFLTNNTEKTNMNRKFLIIGALFSLMTFHSYAQIDSLQNKIKQIIKTKNAVVGVSICGIENNEYLNINGEKHFPMQSVLKFHIALAVLEKVNYCPIRGALFAINIPMEI